MNDIALLALLFNRYFEYGAPPKHIKHSYSDKYFPLYYDTHNLISFLDDTGVDIAHVYGTPN